MLEQARRALARLQQRYDAVTNGAAALQAAAEHLVEDAAHRRGAITPPPSSRADASAPLSPTSSSEFGVQPHAAPPRSDGSPGAPTPHTPVGSVSRYAAAAGTPPSTAPSSAGKTSSDLHTSVAKFVLAMRDRA